MSAYSICTWGDLYSYIFCQGSVKAMEDDMGLMNVYCTGKWEHKIPAPWQERTDMLCISFDLVGVSPLDYSGEDVLLPPEHPVELTSDGDFIIPRTLEPNGETYSFFVMRFVRLHNLVPCRSARCRLDFIEGRSRNA